MVPLGIKPIVGHQIQYKIKMSDREYIKKLDYKNIEIPTKNKRFPKNR